MSTLSPNDRRAKHISHTSPHFINQFALPALLVASSLAGCGGGDSASEDSVGNAAPLELATSGSSDSSMSAAALSSTEDARDADLGLVTADATVAEPVDSMKKAQKAAPVRAKAATAAVVTPVPGYYVDAVVGNDSNPGTFSAPWKTLAKLNSARLKTGEGIYLQCGQVWRESLTLSWTQLVDGNIIAGYGDCSTAKATITGADNFSSGWTKSGNVWSRPVPAGTPKIARLTVNGGAHRVAQWPNYGGVGQEYAISSPTSPTGNTTLQVASGDLPQLSGKDLVGAVVQVRDEPHVIDQASIATYNSATGTIALTAPTTNGMEPGDGYVLQGKLWMLDAPGEFYHDTAKNMLYVYPTDSASQANLNSVLIEGTVRAGALQLVNRNYLVVKNLAFTKTTGDGLFLNEVPGATADTIEASGNARAGVRMKLGTLPPSSSRGMILKNSLIADNWLYGVDAGYALNADVLNNSISDVGTIANAGNSAAAVFSGDGARVQNNSIHRSASYGVRFSGTGATNIYKNDILNYCTRLSDCAAVYTWNGPQGSQKTFNQTSMIDSNRIWNAKANTQGSPAGASGIVVGVYLDDFSMGSTVQNNVIANTPMGIYVHNGSHHTVSNNRIWFTSSVALWANMNLTNTDYMTNNVFSSNQLIPIGGVTGTYPALPSFTVSNAIWFTNQYSGLASLSTSGNFFTGNRIVQLNGSSGEAAWVVSPTDQLHITAAGWRGLNPSEPAPTVPATFARYALTLGTELVANGDFTTALDPWGHQIVTPSLGGSLVAAANIAGCSGMCASFTASSTSDMLNSPGFGVDTTTPYVMGFNATYAGTARVRPWLGRNGTPWDNLIASPGLKSQSSLTGSAGDSYRYEGFFQATTSAMGRLNLQMSTVGVNVAMDSASVRPLTGYSLSKPSDWSIAMFSTISSAKTYSCVDFGWPANCSVVNADGTAVALPVTIPAQSAQVFLRADSPWKR